MKRIPTEGRMKVRVIALSVYVLGCLAAALAGFQAPDRPVLAVGKDSRAHLGSPVVI